jgi:hypothetical protein
MRKILIALLILVAGSAVAQPTNYTRVAGRYRWTSGYFDSTLHLPSGTTPKLGGGFNGPGALFYKTSDSAVYKWTGTQWLPLALSDNIYTANGTLTGDRVVTISTRRLDFTRDIYIDSLRFGRGNSRNIVNAAVGFNALSANTTGNSNTAMGYESMKPNTTGSNNTAYGYRSLWSNITGSSNTAIGSDAMVLGGGSSNTFVGASAGRNVSGSFNSYFGAPSGTVTITGNYNIGLGAASLGNSVSGSNNIGIGQIALSLLTSGSDNIGIGTQSLNSITTTTNSIGIGYQSLFNSSASYGIGIGSRAGFGNTTGTYNIYLGHYVNTGTGLTTGSYNTIIGSAISGLAAGLSNNIILADGQGNMRLVFDNSGNAVLGGGTTYPTFAGYKFQVNGTGMYTGALYTGNPANTTWNGPDNGGVLFVKSNTSGGGGLSFAAPSASNSHRFLSFRVDGGYDAWLSINGGTLTTSGNLITGSITASGLINANASILITDNTDNDRGINFWRQGSTQRASIVHNSAGQLYINTGDAGGSPSTTTGFNHIRLDGAAGSFRLQNTLIRSQNNAIGDTVGTPNVAAVLELKNGGANYYGLKLPSIDTLNRKVISDGGNSDGTNFTGVFTNGSNIFTGYNGGVNLQVGDLVFPNALGSANSYTALKTGENRAIVTNVNGTTITMDRNYVGTSGTYTVPRLRTWTIPEGLMIYNNSVKTIDYYNGTAWTSLASGNIYTSNGTLTGDRVVSTTSGYTLTFNPKTIFTDTLLANKPVKIGFGTDAVVNADAYILRVGGSIRMTGNNLQMGAGSPNVDAHIEMATGKVKINQFGSAGSSSVSIIGLGSGNSAVAIGVSAAASGLQSIAIGSATASATNSVAIGQSSVANGMGAVAIGGGSTAAAGGLAIGGTVGTGAAVAIGGTSLGASAVAIGATVFNSGNYSVVIGDRSRNYYSSSIVMGIFGRNTGNNQFVAGSNDGLNNGYVSNVYFGSGPQRDSVSNGDGSPYTINGSGALGTNFRGGDINIAGGKATGNQLSGDILFSTSVAGSTGTTLQNLTERAKVYGTTGDVRILNRLGFGTLGTATFIACTPSTTGGTIPDGVYYYYTVATIDTLGNIGNTNVATFAIITGGGGNGSISVSWNAVSNATSYRIYRRVGFTSSVQFFDTYSTSFLDINQTGTAFNFGLPENNNDGYAVKSYISDNTLYSPVSQTFNMRGNFVVGPNTAPASALLSVESTTKGFLMPRMTNTQMTSISSPATGLQVFNTTDSSLYVYRGTTGGWSALGGGGSATSGTYTPTITNGTNISSTNQYEMRWYRIGDRIFVQGAVGINATAIGSAYFRISLPTASNLTGQWDDLSGSVVSAGAGTGVITAGTANDDADVTYSATFVGVTVINSVSFSYIVK